MKKFYYLLLFLALISCSKDEPVIADFDVSLAENGKVTLTNKSTGADTYEWDFGNGINSIEKNPSVQYDSNKDYTINLTAKGKSGQNTKPKTVKITNVIEPSDNFVGTFSGTMLYSCCNTQNKITRKAIIKINKVDKNTISVELTQLGGYGSSNIYQESLVSDIFRFSKVKAESQTSFKIDESIITFDGTSNRRCVGTMTIAGSNLIIKFDSDFFSHKYEMTLQKN